MRALKKIFSRKPAGAAKGQEWQEDLAPGQQVEAAPLSLPFQVLEPQQVRDGVAGDMLILDVRTSREYQTRRLAGARHIPLAELHRRLGELDRGRPIMVYCEHGVRSQTACMLLAENGFEQLFHMEGGLSLYRGKCESG